MDKFEVAGSPMVGIDNTGNARIVQTDKDGKLMVSGVLSGGGSGESSNSSLTSVLAKTPSSSTFAPTRAIYIGGFGDITVTIGGADVTMNNLAVGVWHPLSVTAIKTINTTATNILVGY